MERTISKILSNWTSGLPEIIVKAPGRINIIGEHTDYNQGYALTASINQGIYCAAAKFSSDVYEVESLDAKGIISKSLDCDHLHPSGSWANYVIGVVQELQKVVGEIDAFRMTFTGDIPQGAGLSSSAALENAIVFCLNELFEFGLSKEEMILISQKAEHNYVGVYCGIMDQLSSMFGQKNNLLQIDFLNNDFKKIAFELNDYELILINSNVTHELASSEYNKRREECESALIKIQNRFPEVKSFRQLNQKIYTACKDILSETEWKRVQYIDMERIRVLSTILYLESQEYIKLGELLFQGHHGLQKLYEVTCEETDFLVKKAKESSVVIGARQMGGGFGGCTINLIQKGKAKEFYTTTLQEDYKNNFHKELTLIPIEISDGTKIIWKNGAIT